MQLKYDGDHGVQGLCTTIVVGRITASKDVRVLTPGTCEYFSLHGKRNFAGVIKLRALINGESILGYAGEPNLIMRVLKSREPFLAVLREM